jgi:hypothetical protein
LVVNRKLQTAWAKKFAEGRRDDVPLGFEAEAVTVRIRRA